MRLHCRTISQGRKKGQSSARRPRHRLDSLATHRFVDDVVGFFSITAALRPKMARGATQEERLLRVVVDETVKEEEARTELDIVE